ncbi:MAG: Asp23/Gls24 family envelope stress response protein, partial [Oscillospiraceae bacterium]|nr:Asp23/Gls24 family envelope stress response protein [Oscillospiraceae bacterium]
MRMDQIKKSERTIQISDEVLRQVAALSIRDIAGVAGLLPEKNVSIANLGGAIAVELRIFVKSGCRAAAVAARVQQVVKQSIQDMTGVTAVHVNVEIKGIAQGEL